MMTTKVRLFGPETKSEESESDEENLEFASGADPVTLVHHLKQQLKSIKKVYTNQVVNSVKIVKKLR